MKIRSSEARILCTSFTTPEKANIIVGFKYLPNGLHEQSDIEAQRQSLANNEFAINPPTAAEEQQQFAMGMGG